MVARTAALAVRVKDETRRGAASAKAGIKGIGDAAKQTETSVKGMVGGLGQLKNALSAVATALAIREVIHYADAWTQVENRLRLVTESAVELEQVQTSLFQVTQETRAPLQATAELYQRLERSGRDLGLTQNELVRLTRTINQTLVVSGASGEAASAALVQLGQGFASGVLRGEELNSVLEQTPRLAEAIADGLGVPIGALRELGAAGELTAARVIKALQSQATTIETEFGTTTQTVGQSFTTLNNSLTVFIGKLDDAVAGTAGLSSAIIALSRGIDNIGDFLDRPAVQAIFTGARLAVTPGASPANPLSLFPAQQSSFAAPDINFGAFGPGSGVLLPGQSLETSAERVERAGEEFKRFIEEAGFKFKEDARTLVPAIERGLEAGGFGTGNQVGRDVQLRAEALARGFGNALQAELPESARGSRVSGTFIRATQEVIEVRERETDIVRDLAFGIDVASRAFSGLHPVLDDLIATTARAVASGSPILAVSEGIGFLLRRLTGYKDENERLIDAIERTARASRQAAQDIERLATTIDDQTLRTLQNQRELLGLLNLTGFSRIRELADPDTANRLRTLETVTERLAGSQFTGNIPAFIQALQSAFPSVDLTNLEAIRGLAGLSDELRFAVENFGRINVSTFAGAREEFGFQRSIQSPETRGELAAILQTSFAQIADFDFEALTFTIKDGVELTQRELRTLEQLLAETSRFREVSEDFYSESLRRENRLQFDLAEIETRRQAQQRLTGDPRADQQVFASLTREIRALRQSEEAFEQAGGVLPGPQVPAGAARPVADPTSQVQPETFGDAIDVSDTARIELLWSDAIQLTAATAADFGADAWEDIVIIPGDLPKIVRFWSDIVRAVEREDEKILLNDFAKAFGYGANPVQLDPLPWGLIPGRPFEQPGIKHLLDDFNTAFDYGTSPSLLAGLPWGLIADRPFELVGVKHLLDDFGDAMNYGTSPSLLPAVPWGLTLHRPFELGGAKHLLDDFGEAMNYGTSPSRLAGLPWGLVTLRPFEQGGAKHLLDDFQEAMGYGTSPSLLAGLPWGLVTGRPFEQGGAKHLLDDFREAMNYGTNPAQLPAVIWTDVIPAPAAAPEGAKHLFDDYNDIVRVDSSIPPIDNISPTDLFSFGGTKISVSLDSVIDPNSEAVRTAHGILDPQSKFNITPSEGFSFGGNRFSVNINQVFDTSSEAFAFASGFAPFKYSIDPDDMFVLNPDAKIPADVNDVFDFGDTLDQAIEQGVVAYFDNTDVFTDPNSGQTVLRP